MEEILLAFIGIGAIIIFFIMSIYYKNNPNKKEEYFYEKTEQEKIPFSSSYSKYFIKATNNIDALDFKIELLKSKIKNVASNLARISSNNELLIDNVSTDMNANSIYHKNIEIIDYLTKYYDKYVALYIKTCFSSFIYYLSKKDLRTIDIKKTINEIQKNTNAIIYNYLPKNKTYDEIINTHEFCGKTLNRIINDINTIKIQLVSLQTQLIISTISPIDNEYNINKYCSTNEQISLDLSKLNNEYDRFIAEIEVI